MANIQKLSERIREDAPKNSIVDNYVQYYIDMLERHWVPELAPNVEEWAEHRDLSPIFVRDLTVQMVLDIWRSPGMFIEAVSALYEYKHSELPAT